MDMTLPPALHPIGKLSIPVPQKLFLGNQLPVHVVKAGDQEVLKIEFLFRAGRKQESARAVAVTTAHMLKEGTHRHGSFEISSTFDFYGATCTISAGVENSSCTLFTLKKHLPDLLPLLRELFTESVFPERELETYIQNSKQKLLVSREKVEYLAHKKLLETLYGEHHYLSYHTAESDFDQLNPALLREFCRQCYSGSHCEIIVSGKTDDAVVSLLDRYFGGKDWLAIDHITRALPVVPEVFEPNYFVEKKDAVQSALRMGKHFINRLHPDWNGLKFLNTLLGGYFGSRLMSNLREDKGYCYGIHSGMASFSDHGYFYIASEVGSEVTSQAVNEIFREINRLRNEPVPEEEMNLVRNYLTGVLLADLDGPFNLSEIIKNYVMYRMDYHLFEEQVETIRSISSSQIQELANAYLQPDTLVTVVCGAQPL